MSLTLLKGRVVATHLSVRGTLHTFRHTVRCSFITFIVYDRNQWNVCGQLTDKPTRPIDNRGNLTTPLTCVLTVFFNQNGSDKTVSGVQ